MADVFNTVIYVSFIFWWFQYLLNTSSYDINSFQNLETLKNMYFFPSYVGTNLSQLNLQIFNL